MALRVGRECLTKACPCEPPRPVAAHDHYICGNAELRHHVELINGALDFIDTLITAESHRDEDELAVFRLAARCFNSGAASLRLLRCAYWQRGFALVRDLLETVFLLDLLISDRLLLREWRSLAEKERERRFRPVKVREQLDARDGFTGKRRAEAYQLLSHYAAHPTPEGSQIISPGSITNVGPYESEPAFWAALFELAKHLAQASVLMGRVPKPRADLLLRKAAHLQMLEQWRTAYLSAPLRGGVGRDPSG
jgi:hypothetical protein